jgi:hypothetical protein
MNIRYHVDTWDPSYGSTVDTEDEGPVTPSSAQLDLAVERPPSSWQPLSPPGDTRAPAVVRLVDGVRRIDARVWVEQTDRALLPALAASYAAGMVRCDLGRGAAELTDARVRRGLFTPSPDAGDLGFGSTGYSLRRVKATEPATLIAAIQPALQALESEVSTSERDEDDLLVIDGPLRDRFGLPRALGYIKTHHRQYLADEQSSVIAALRPGQRTPVFLIGRSFRHFSWYLKLPGGGTSPWGGVVRVEASGELTRPAAVELADRSALTLPRLSSLPYKDPRAPQNLVPIAGLEGRLRRMLGDPRLLVRALMAAARA